MKGLGRVIWSGWFRVIAFWVIAAAAFWASTAYFATLDLGLNWENFRSALAQMRGPNLAQAFAAPDFATSLAWIIAGVGVGLLAAYIVMHAAVVRLSLWRVRRALAKYKRRPEFAQDYEARLYPRLIAHPLIGHAWKEFDETLLKDGASEGLVIGNTVRPQSFINYGLAKEKLTGLKMLGSISGYFIGVGLLLTFVGIVLALGTAGAAVGQPGDAMQRAVADLLRVASFKFSTSIAGLGVSIAFAIFAKLIVVWIEGAFSRFCETVEHQLLYTAPQSIAAEMHEVAKEQRDELKEINSDRYFTRLADVISPLISAAMDRALSPVTVGIGSAVEQLKATSQSGMSDLLQEFSSSVQGSAGTELRELGETLKQMQATLRDTQSGLHGTGEDFARRMSDAAENLNRLVGEAGSRLEGSAEQNRAGLEQVVAAMRETFDRANARIESELGSAAAGASGKVEEAMGRVMVRLEEQVGSLMTGLEGFQTSSASNLVSVREQVVEAQAGAVAQITSASAEAAKALEEGLRSAMQRIADEIDRFQRAMSSGEAALARQANAIGEAANQTRSVSEAFARTAQDARAAAAPLAQSGERIAQASSEMVELWTRTASGLEATNTAATGLSTALTDQISRLGTMWAGYKDQFDRVDEALAGAVGKLAEATEGQAERLTTFAGQMDRDLATVMRRLQTSIQEISENTGELSETVEQLAKGMARQAAE